jgi:dTMP kinase
VTSAHDGLWVCVDGTEGTGKTTLTAALIEAVGGDGINEFSDAPFGAALREAVRKAPHFISVSPRGQSLVFLGDFLELYDSKIAPALNGGRVVITDRGWLTKYAYQKIVLQNAMSDDEADALLRHILGLIPAPDLTILLTAPLEVIRARLRARDGHCDDGRASFITRAAAAAREFAASIPDLRWVLVRTDRDPADVLREAATEVRRTQAG